MSDDLDLTEALATFESALAEPMVAVPVEKAADVPVPMRTVKTVIRDANNRIARVDEVQVPMDPAVAQAQKAAARMTRENLFKTLRDVLQAEIAKRGVDPADVCTCCAKHRTEAKKALTVAEYLKLKGVESMTTLEDLDTSS